MNYDPLNRLTTMVDGVGTTLYGYLPSLKLRQAGDAIERGTALAKAPAAAEAMARQAAPWPNDTVNYTYANRLRASLSVQAPNGAPWSQSYGYDTARRLTGVQHGIEGSVLGIWYFV
jgi:hypothetical protein